jgi:hypothetical protein
LQSQTDGKGFLKARRFLDTFIKGSIATVRVLPSVLFLEATDLKGEVREVIEHALPGDRERTLAPDQGMGEIVQTK